MKNYEAWLEAVIVFLLLIVAAQAWTVHVLLHIRRVVDSPFPLWFKRSPYDDSTKEPPR